jgi:hypothetical protein
MEIQTWQTLDCQSSDQIYAHGGAIIDSVHFSVRPRLAYKTMMAFRLAPRAA